MVATKRLLKLTFVKNGEPYHTVELSPRAARDLLITNKAFTFRVPGDPTTYQLTALSHAEISRRSRAAVAVLEGDEHEVIIDVA